MFTDLITNIQCNMQLYKIKKRVLALLYVPKVVFLKTQMPHKVVGYVKNANGRFCFFPKVKYGKENEKYFTCNNKLLLI